MSNAARASMNQPASERAFRDLLRALRSYRVGGFLKLAGRYSLQAGAAVLAVAAVVVTAERLVGLSKSLQQTLLVTTVLVPVLIAGVLLWRWRGFWRLSFWLRELTARDPDLGWKLRVGLGLWKLRKTNARIYSQSLVDEGLTRTASASSRVPKSPRIGVLPTRRRLFLALFLTPLAAVVCYPRASTEAALRIIRSSGPPRLSIYPQLQRVARGSRAHLRVVADPPTVAPPTVEASLDSTHWDPAATPEPADSAGHFDVTVGPVEVACMVRARRPGVLSPVARVLIQPRPNIVGLSLRVTYPGYTDVGTVAIPQGTREVRALKGCILEVVATLSDSTAEARIVCTSGNTLSMNVLGESARASMPVTADDTLRIALRDSLGQQVVLPCCSVIALDDDPPSVAITEPGRDTRLKEEMVLPLTVEAEDDFGFSRSSIRWRRRETRAGTVVSRGPQRAPSFRLRHVWDLTTVSFLPGDTLAYWAEVVDNDPARGGKHAVSDTFRLRFPSLSEILMQTAAQQHEASTEMHEALREQEELLGRTEEIGADDDLSWEKKRAGEQLVEDQESLINELSRTAEDLRTTLEETDETESGLSKRIATEAARLHQLLNELDDPSLRSAMEELRRALAALEPDKVSQAAEHMRISQLELLSKLQRTVSALERLMAEQMLRAAMHEALELAARQESINQRNTADSTSTEGLSREQTTLTEDAEQLGQQLEETAARISELSSATAEAVTQQEERVDRKIVPASREAAGALGRGDRKQSGRKGSEVQQELSDVAASLQSALDSMRQGFGNQVAQSLRDTASRLLDCSVLQEDLGKRAAGARRGSPLSQEQVEISEMVQSVADDLEALGKETFFLSPQIAQPLIQSLGIMDRVARHLSAGADKAAQDGAQQAVGALNRSVNAMLEAAAQAQQGGSGSGFQQALDRLTALCQQQAQLNSRCQGMLSQEGSPVPSFGDLLAQLAAEQEAVRAALEDVASAAEGRSHIAGPLGAAGADMEDVGKQLRGEGPTGETIKTQQRILTRMLEARNSLYRQGYREKRRSEEAKTYTRVRPSSPSGIAEQPEERSVRRTGFYPDEAPPEYRRYVDAYFAAIRDYPSQKKEDSSDRQRED